MNVYVVTIEYKDVIGEKDFYARPELSETLSPQQVKDLAAQMPGPKTVTYHAVVFPRFGGEAIAAACDAAVRAVVGPPECWEEWMPTVTSVRLLGSAVVEVAP